MTPSGPACRLLAKLKLQIWRLREPRRIPGLTGPAGLGFLPGGQIAPLSLLLLGNHFEIREDVLKIEPEDLCALSSESNFISITPHLLLHLFSLCINICVHINIIYSEPSETSFLPLIMGVLLHNCNTGIVEKEMATHSDVLAGESQGRGSLVGCRLWGRTGWDTTEAT